VDSTLASTWDDLAAASEAAAAQATWPEKAAHEATSRIRQAAEPPEGT
jgi:hypothetical protein